MAHNYHLTRSRNQAKRREHYIDNQWALRKLKREREAREYKRAQQGIQIDRDHPEAPGLNELTEGDVVIITAKKQSIRLSVIVAAIHDNGSMTGVVRCHAWNTNGVALDMYKERDRVLFWPDSIFAIQLS
jgi:hypothetical protein